MRTYLFIAAMLPFTAWSQTTTGYPCVPTTSTATFTACPPSCYQSTITYTTTAHATTFYYPPCPTLINVLEKRTCVGTSTTVTSTLPCSVCAKLPASATTTTTQTSTFTRHLICPLD